MLLLSFCTGVFFHFRSTLPKEKKSHLEDFCVRVLKHSNDNHDKYDKEITDLFIILSNLSKTILFSFIQWLLHLIAWTRIGVQKGQISVIGHSLYILPLYKKKFGVYI